LTLRAEEESDNIIFNSTEEYEEEGRTLAPRIWRVASFDEIYSILTNAKICSTMILRFDAVFSKTALESTIDLASTG
jgi:hypothetical protein